MGGPGAVRAWRTGPKTVFGGWSGILAVQGSDCGTDRSKAVCITNISFVKEDAQSFTQAHVGRLAV